MKGSERAKVGLGKQIRLSGANAVNSCGLIMTKSNPKHQARES